MFITFSGTSVVRRNKLWVYKNTTNIFVPVVVHYKSRYPRFWLSLQAYAKVSVI